MRCHLVDALIGVVVVEQALTAYTTDEANANAECNGADVTGW